MNQKFNPWGFVLPVLALTALTASVLAQSAPSSRIACERFTIQSALSDTDVTKYTVAGTLCSPSGTQGRTVQVLLSGSFYDQSYWDFPYQPEVYSYVRAMNAAGYATLAFDRPGVGLSGKPPADKLSGDAYAFVTNRMVTELRKGIFSSKRFGKVVLVGHSFGSSTAVETAITYKNVDGLVLTALLHAFGPGGEKFNPAVYLAADDARFKLQTLPAGYLTLRPGDAGRTLLFLNVANTDPNVTAVDEATKWTTAGGEANSFLKIVTTPAITQVLKLPILSVNGALDSIFCSPPDCPQAKDEAKSYSSEAKVQISVIPNTAHAINLHKSAPETYGLIRAWLDKTFGTGVSK